MEKNKQYKVSITEDKDDNFINVKRYEGSLETPKTIMPFPYKNGGDTSFPSRKQALIDAREKAKEVRKVISRESKVSLEEVLFEDMVED